MCEGNNMNILTPIISGILALLGAYIGALLSRRTQHQNWLLQKRAESFSELWSTIETSQNESAQYLRSTADQGLKKEQKLMDIFSPAFTKARIVNLFVTIESRKRIRELVTDINVIISTESLGDSRFKRITKNIEELQSIMDKELRNKNW